MPICPRPPALRRIECSIGKSLLEAALTQNSSPALSCTMRKLAKSLVTELSSIDDVDAEYFLEVFQGRPVIEFKVVGEGKGVFGCDSA